MDRDLAKILRLPLDAPATALEEVQGAPFPFFPGARLARQRPIDAGLLPSGWANPYKATLYPVTADIALSSQALQANLRRSYLLIQNKGPGNLFVNFSQAADAINSITLVPTQVYELIGGAEGGGFVMRDSVWVLTDVAGTTAVIIEGVAVPTSHLIRGAV